MTSAIRAAEELNWEIRDEELLRDAAAVAAFLIRPLGTADLDLYAEGKLTLFGSMDTVLTHAWFVVA